MNNCRAVERPWSSRSCNSMCPWSWVTMFFLMWAEAMSACAVPCTVRRFCGIRDITSWSSGRSANTLRAVTLLSRPTSKSPRTEPEGRVRTMFVESFPVSNRRACTSHTTSPSADPCTVRPPQVPLQIEPSTLTHETADGGAGTTQLAGKRAITMAAKATTARTVIRTPRRTCSSIHVQDDSGVHEPGAAGTLDRGRVHPDSVLL
jgi:hypothetical protein